jgi:hypothetical protein
MAYIPLAAGKMLHHFREQAEAGSVTIIAIAHVHCWPVVPVAATLQRRKVLADKQSNSE